MWANKKLLPLTACKDNKKKSQKKSQLQPILSMGENLLIPIQLYVHSRSNTGIPIAGEILPVIPGLSLT